MKTFYALPILGALAVSTSLCLSGIAAATDLETDMSNPSDWASQAGDYANHRYSTLDQINAKNVGNLQVAWTMSTGVLRGHEGSPLVIGNTMYIHTPFPNNVYAINLADQTYKWKYEPKQDATVVPVMCCDTVNRGLAFGDGKIFLQQADTTLVALDATTGKVDWTVKNGNPKIGETNTNAPHVFGSVVLTGISGGEFGVRGRMQAYDIKTGKLLWKAYSTGPDEEMLIDPAKTMTWTNGKMAPVGKDSSLKTWKGDQWKIGGGTTWGWYSYDPKLNLVYYGTGNPSTWNPNQRPGDNKWSMTILARDLNSGMAKWVYQMTPHDEWDFDGVNEMVLADVKMGGKEVPALVHFDRNGFGYTMNRATGELLVAQKYDPNVNWATERRHEDRPPDGRQEVLARHHRPGRRREGHLPGRARLQGRAALELRPEIGPGVRADQPCLHDLRAVPDRVHGGPALCGRDPDHVPDPEQPWRHGQFHRLGSGGRQDRLVQAGAFLGMVGRADHGG